MIATTRLRAFGIAAALLGSTMLAPAHAQVAGAPEPPPEQIAMPKTGADAVQSVTLTVNKTKMFAFDTDIDDVIIANPGIANVVARDRRTLAVMGVAPGESNIVITDRAGRRIVTLEMSVTDGVAGMDQLRDFIRRYVPAAKVNVEGVNGGVILSGMVPDATGLDKVMTLARRYVKDDKSIINMMNVAAKDQVTLKVRIVEMQRSVVKQLGINLAGDVGFGKLDPTKFQGAAQIASSNSFGVAGSALGGLAADLTYTNFNNGVQQSVIGMTINAFERIGLLRTLAEPNLTVISGESGKFLAGGSFPVPVAQDQGKIGIEFKDFGVSLGFTPVVLSEGRISLQVATSVSELTQQGAFASRSVAGVNPDTGQLINGQTISVPALKMRSAATTVEIPSGGSMVIAGLIQEQTKQSLDGLPGVKDLPILGALFRSRDFQNDETEMVVIITPYLVDPTDPQNLRDPDRGYATPRDSQTVLFGRLNEVYAVPGSAVDKSKAPKGAAGFIYE